MKINFLKSAKVHLKLALLAIIMLTATNCSNDDGGSSSLQDPLPGYLSASGFNQKTTDAYSDYTREMGYSFIPLVNGKMTAIVVKIPGMHSGMMVTVWDKAAGTVVRRETIDMKTAGAEVTKQITPLDLVKDKEYFLTYNSNYWYRHSKNDYSEVTYPFTVGDIKITSYAFKNAVTPEMPNSPETDYYAGDCSFKFQK
jgi:hypothetical protein